MTKIGTLFQQDISLLTGEERKRPINPTQSRARGAVRIGNRPVLFTRPVHLSQEELNMDDEELQRTLAAKRQSTLHECISQEMGEPCPHIDQ